MDWSSDVCSSDLVVHLAADRIERFGAEKLELHRLGTAFRGDLDHALGRVERLVEVGPGLGNDVGSGIQADDMAGNGQLACAHRDRSSITATMRNAPRPSTARRPQLDILARRAASCRSARTVSAIVMSLRRAISHRSTAAPSSAKARLFSACARSWESRMAGVPVARSEEQTSELQSLMRN